MSDHTILFPQPAPVTVGTRRVLVRPVELQHFEAFGVAAAGLIGMLGSESAARLYDYAKRTGALQTILGGGTDLSRWRIARLPVPVAIELMVTVIRINASFFDQALVKAAKALAGAK